MASSRATVSEFCRFCRKNLRIHGVLSSTVLIFEKGTQPKTPSERFAALGLCVNRCESRSTRMCKGCLTVLTRLERDYPFFKQWQEAESSTNEPSTATSTSTETISEKRPHTTPSKTPRDRKKVCLGPPSTLPPPSSSSSRKNITKILTALPSKSTDQTEAGIIQNIANKKWKSAANSISSHKELMAELKPILIGLLQKEATGLCNPNHGFMLWKTSPEDLRTFSFSNLLQDFERHCPFLLSIFQAICKNNIPVLCAGLSITLRGREPRLSAFAYYLNSILQHGGAKKAAFTRLSKMAITTNHSNAVGKQKEIAQLCGEALQTLKVSNELFLNNSERQYEIDISRSMEDITLTNNGDDVQLTELPFSQQQNSELSLVQNRSMCSSSLQPAPPASYSIVFDNIDFYMKAHNQSSLHTNKSIHWVHHIAVEDRIPINHLSNEKPVSDVSTYNINHSLPGPETQSHIRREYTVLGSRILTEYLDAFKPLSKVVVRHIPHQYSDETAQRSIDYPLGLLFKSETKNAELIEVLRHIQNEYVPRGPDGLFDVLVGGDRLTEANSRNIQWAFTDSNTKEGRLEGLVFKFEDWHAIGNLLQIHYKIFFNKESSKDHGTLLANMNLLRCTNAKQGPKKAYNDYKSFVMKDTSALFLAAAMECFSLKDVKDTPENFIPDAVITGTEDDKRDWLHAKTAEVIDMFVLFNTMITVDGVEKVHFPCCEEGCGQQFLSEKARQVHERKKHNIVSSTQSLPLITSTTPKMDHKKEHSEARLGFGFLVLNLLDAVKEGDGERLLRLYKVALLYYKAYGHTQYAYSTFLMSLQVNYTLSQRMAHSVTWNRFWNSRGGRSNNIPLDLHLEHLNNYLKSFLKGLGPNLNENSADRVSRSIGVLKEFMDNTDVELQATTSVGHHHTRPDLNDILTLVDIFLKDQLFKCQPQREFGSFPSFQKNLLRKINYDDLSKWMKTKLKEWRKVTI